MCSVSAIMDYGRNVWPPLNEPWRAPRPQDQLGPKPAMEPAQEREAIKRFMDIVEAAKKFDDASGQPHCEDPEKTKLLERIAERLTAIEKHLGLSL